MSCVVRIRYNSFGWEEAALCGYMLVCVAGSSCCWSLVVRRFAESVHAHDFMSLVHVRIDDETFCLLYTSVRVLAEYHVFCESVRS